MRLFYFRLALELGMTVRELELRMGASEIQEWMAYFEIVEEEMRKGG